MKDYTYHSVEEWRRSIITLNDDVFFTLINGTIGNVKTPYNKQKLAGDLQAFLARPDVRDTIDALIDENDIEIISALALLGAPDKQELVELLAGSANNIVLHNRIQNMEERLLIYRSQEDESVTFHLNPVLADILNKYKGNYSYLLPEYTILEETFASAATNNTAEAAQDADEEFPQALFNDAVIAAALRFTACLQEPVKGDGLLKKKALDEFEQVFGKIDAETYTGILCVLGLITKKESVIEEDEQKIASFAALSANERRVYCAAALYIYKTGGIEPKTGTPSMSSYIEKVSISMAASFIYSLLTCLKEISRLAEDGITSVFPARTLKRITLLLRKNFSSRYYFSKPFARDEDFLFSIICKSGLLRRAELTEGAPESAGIYYALPLNMDFSGGVKTGKISFNGAFSCITAPETPFNEAAKIALLGSLTSVDISGGTPLIQHEIKRTGVQRALDRGLSADEILDTLKRLSGGTEDESLIWSINEWTKRSSEVTVYDTLCVTLSGEQLFAARAPSFSRLILSNPAPGVFILNTKNKKTVLDALAKCGIDTVSSPSDKENKKFASASYYNGYSHLSYIEAFGGMRGNAFTNGRDAGEIRRTIVDARKNDLQAAVDSAPLSEPQKEALKNRISKRLIVSLSQMEGIKVNEEKLEARGMDYNGKIALAKQAVETKDLLEIEINGSEERILVKPISIGKRESDTVISAVTVNTTEGGEKKNISFPLGKIKYIRRLKNSSSI
ncbi:MAG: hypothetical protein LBG72_03960 [Spirochaetaceae bacterium]|jgi:hypothetical protein|nr:hypothetical protein [Spirochaetaceae bacterium]